MIQGAECECGKKLVPYRNVCPRCGKNMVKVEFEEKGVVLTHTTLYAVPEGFKGPLRLAMIELEDGANLICGYEGEGDLRIGDRVEIKMKGELFVCEPMK